MKANGNADDLFTETGLTNALIGVEGVTTDLIKSLIEDKESVEKLIAFNLLIYSSEKAERSVNSSLIACCKYSFCISKL